MKRSLVALIVAAGVGVITIDTVWGQRPGKGGGRPGGQQGANPQGQGQGPGGQGQGQFPGGPGGPSGPGGMNRQEAMKFIPVTAVLDTNQDAEISADEIANASASLLTLDANGDGKLTAEELLPKGPPGGGRGFGGGPGFGPSNQGQGPGQGQGPNQGQGQGQGGRPKRPQ